MSSKKKFCIIFSLISILLIVLLLLRPQPAESDILVIEFYGNDAFLVPIMDLRLLDGIDFNNLEEDADVLAGFYERYRASKGESLIKVFHLNTILELSGVEDLEYSRLVFHSVDYARVLISGERLVLLALEFEDGEYTLRLIMPEDRFSQRWLKNVVRIEVQ